MYVRAGRPRYGDVEVGEATVIVEAATAVDTFTDLHRPPGYGNTEDPPQFVKPTLRSSD